MLSLAHSRFRAPHKPCAGAQDMGPECEALVLSTKIKTQEGGLGNLLRMALQSRDCLGMGLRHLPRPAEQEQT